jgi:hypothetical protein
MSGSMFAQGVATVRASMSWSHDELLAEIQTTLAALADIECRYEAEREAFEQEPGSDLDKRCRAVERERRYRHEREPYLRRIHELQRRIMTQLRCGL